MSGLSRERRFPPRPEALSQMRDFGRSFLRRAGASDEEVSDVALAYAEACTNAVEHAGGDRPLVLSAQVLDDAVRLSVRDFGHWRFSLQNDAFMPTRGRGLTVARRLVDNFAIRRHPDGTEIVLYRRLRKERARATRPVPVTRPARQAGVTMRGEESEGRHGRGIRKRARHRRHRGVCRRR